MILRSPLLSGFTGREMLMVRRSALACAGVVVVAIGCVAGSSGRGDTPAPRGSVVAAAGPTQSSPIALSADDAVLVCVNQDQDTISIFDALKGVPVKVAEVPVGREPRSIALRPD